MKYLIIVVLYFMCLNLFSQVKVNYNNTQLIGDNGHYHQKFKKKYYSLPSPDTSKIIAKEFEDSSSPFIKPFRFAFPIKVDIDVSKEGDWHYDSLYAYCKLDINVDKAKSLSINMDKFYLPKDAEIYIYNDKGKMITGPITEAENNKNKVWGSSVYKGNTLTIELKLPKASKNILELHISNIASGYKEIFSSYNYGGFGQSSSCEINVLCPLGSNWQQERNSIALILNQEGSVWCSGAMINNTCNLNIPYLLTANHCLENGTENVALWRFIFQYWSTQCTPSIDNTNTLLFNGSVLHANYDVSDFALVELNQSPDPSSGITYAGWNRNSNPAISSTAIHHPLGDVMKIANDVNAPIAITWPGIPNLTHWRSHFQQGTVEHGSSGSPLFDQNHRIIGQLHGKQNTQSNYCSEQIGEYGRFDVSWVGGGTNSTRLSNWLDPNNSGIMNTNTTNVSSLFNINGINNIIGSSTICTFSNYSITTPLNVSNVTWYVNPITNANFSCNSCNNTTLTSTVGSAEVYISATYTNSCLNQSFTEIKSIHLGLPQILSNSGGTFTGGGPSMGYTAATGTLNERWYPCAGYYVQSNLSTNDYIGATSINWSVLSHSSVLPVPNTNPIRFYFFGTNQKATIRLTASNSCGSVTKDYDFVSKNCSSNPGNPCGHFIVKRNNIAAKMVTVSTSTNITAPCYGNLAKGETSFADERLTGIVIYNKQGTVVKDVCITDTSTQLLNVDLSDLNNGVYSVEVKGLKSYKEVQPIVLSTYNDIASAELIASGEVSTSADRLLVLQQELYNDILELHPDWVDSSTVLQSFVDNNSNSSFGYCYAINDLLQQNNIDDADALLQTWTTANHIDNNYYKYYQYYISFARSNSFSAGDISDLYSIASKCALVEGEVINDARSLYNAVTAQVVGFEDACGVGGALPAINTSVSSICVGATASYSEDFPGGVWNTDNSSIASIDGNGVITGIAAGTANIIYTVTSSCGIRTVSAPITVNAIPSVTIGGNNAVCKGNSLQLNSNISGGIWSSSNTGVATIDAASGMISTVSAGQTIVGYSVTGANGCVATATNNITVNALPDATITGATNICLNTTMTYTAGSTGGVWSSSNAGIASINSSTGTVSALGGGQTTITYSVTDANGCFNTKSVTTNVVTKPEVILSASPSPACAGQTITCVANSSDPTANYTWTGSGGTPSPNTGTTVQCVNPTGGTKTFTVTATNGCGVGTKSLSVTVYTLPSAPDISPSGSSNVITIAPCGTQQLKSSVSSGNQWYQDGNAISGATAQTYVAPVGHIYNVTTTNNNGCTSNMSVTKTVQASVFTMSPNPAHTSVSVQGINVAEIDIMSNTGTILISKLVTAGSGSSNTSLSVTGLVTGSYNVIVRYNTGCTQSQVLIVN